MRTLYFDIDGVLLDYNDQQRVLLLDKSLQHRLQHLCFDKLICVSGWSDIVSAGLIKKTEAEEKQAIYQLLQQIFPDAQWFLQKLHLVKDTDHRCKHIDLDEDWYYMDDWADKFFAEQFGQDLYQQQLGKRILLVNPHGNGQDILTWLDGITTDN